MPQSPRYRLTTIERLAPSLEQINFQLTHTALDQQKNIESLAFSVSIEKISFQTIKPHEPNPPSQKSLNLQEKLIEVIDESKIQKTELIKPKEKQNLNKFEKGTKGYKKKREMMQVTKAILYFDDPKYKITNLQSTASTIKNSPAKRSIKETLKFSTNRTKKSISMKPQPAANQKQRQSNKCVCSIQKCRTNRLTPEVSTILPETRKKVFSIRK